jgi:hypothetical protein
MLKFIQPALKNEYLEIDRSDFDMNESVCPVCKSTSRSRGALYRECSTCGLVFAKSMTLGGVTPVEFFSQAYSGKLKGDFWHFNSRLQIQDYLKKMGNSLPFGKAQETFLEILQEKLKPGARVLDIGCGIGLFMRRLKEKGFNPVGLDVGEPVVKELRGEGFQVWHGEVYSYPKDWPEPDACTLNLVLHHTPNPIDFLTIIRQRFPSSLLLVSDIKASKPLYAGWKPPRHLSVWTHQSMKLALQKAGYSVTRTYEFPVAIRSHGDTIFWPLFLRLPDRLRTTKLLRRYYYFKPVWIWPIWIVLRALGMSGNISAIANTTESATIGPKS